MDLLKE